MRSAIAFCVFFFAALAVARPGDKLLYTDRYDHVDVDQILANKRVLQTYFNCLMDKGKCSPDGRELKGNIVDALVNNCSKCTEAQRQGSERVIGHLINNEPQYWTDLTAKYDPSKKYTVKYEERLRKFKA